MENDALLTITNAGRIVTYRPLSARNLRELADMLTQLADNLTIPPTASEHDKQANNADHNADTQSA